MSSTLECRAEKGLLTDILDHVKSFLAKLDFFKHQVERLCFDHFPSMKVVTEEFHQQPNMKTFADHIEVLSNNFKMRFEDFEGRENGLHLFRNPFSALVDLYEPQL